jgi:hypothetical protein
MRRTPVLQRLFPVLYALEFLIALIAVYTVWGELGGQDYLDYMPWYWKAGIGFGAAAAVVRLTAAIEVAGPSARFRITLWALVLACLAICAGLATYYYQLNAPQDQDDAPATVTPTARLACDPGARRG